LLVDFVETQVKSIHVEAGMEHKSFISYKKI